MTTNLIVPIDLAPAPYILADPGFLATLAAVEGQATALKVTDAATAQQAATLQIKLTTAGKDLEKMRQELTAPFLSAQRKIAEVAREPAARIEAAKVSLRKQLTAYDEEQRRIAAEAERAKQAELARLEKLRREEEAREILRQKAEEKTAAEAAAKIAPNAEAGMCLDDDTVTPPQMTETQKAIEALKHTPVVAAPKPAGITYRTTLLVTVTDINLLPDQFVERTAKMAAIRATYCSGWAEGKPLPVVPGCKFEALRTAVSTGR